jgi:hypothetical protein
VELASTPQPLLPADVAERYANVPVEVTKFLAELQTCVSAAGSAWVLTSADFHGAADTAFRWNEFELMALADADDDLAAQTEARQFWDKHFPFMIAVHSDYDFIAVRLDDLAIVHGCGPNWEETSTVAASVSSFFVMLADSANAEPGFPLSIFLSVG